MQDEPEFYFAFSATLRIMDAPERHAEIVERTGLQPSHAHVRGDIASQKTGRTWSNDIWQLKSPLSDEAELSEHLGWLWETVRPHQAYFRSLVEAGVRVDVFCGYRTNCGHCGFSLAPGATVIAEQLHIPLEFSVIIA